MTVSIEPCPTEPHAAPRWLFELADWLLCLAIAVIIAFFILMPLALGANAFSS